MKILKTRTGYVLAAMLFLVPSAGHAQEVPGDGAFAAVEEQVNPKYDEATAALDADEPRAELARQVDRAEAEARGEGPIARVVGAFENSLAFARPELLVVDQFELSLSLGDGIEVDLAKVSEAHGAYVEPPITDPDDLAGAFARAVKVVEDGGVAVLDVRTCNL